jgi:hypothetical protein
MRNPECGVQSDLSCGGYGLTLAEIELMWKTAPDSSLAPAGGVREGQG